MLLLGEDKGGGLRPSLQGEDEEGSMVACLYEAEGEGREGATLGEGNWDFITGNIRGLTGVVGLYIEKNNLF